MFASITTRTVSAFTTVAAAFAAGNAAVVSALKEALSERLLSWLRVMATTAGVWLSGLVVITGATTLLGALWGPIVGFLAHWAQTTAFFASEAGEVVIADVQTVARDVRDAGITAYSYVAAATIVAGDAVASATSTAVGWVTPAAKPVVIVA